MVFSHVDERPVGIGELEFAVGALLEELHARDALVVEIERLRRQLDVLLHDMCEVFSERVEFRDAEAEMVHSRLFDAGAVEV